MRDRIDKLVTIDLTPDEANKLYALVGNCLSADDDLVRVRKKLNRELDPDTFRHYNTNIVLTTEYFAEDSE